MVSLSSFHQIHKDQRIIVCGCGTSLNLLKGYEGRCICIGVNDVGRLFDPNYLVVLNPKSQFKGDRYSFVENSKAEFVFSQLDLKLNSSTLVKFKLGNRKGTDLSDTSVLHYAQNSPYVALCLAAHMGATSIGLIGVDFTKDHFFAKTGTHPLSGRFNEVDADYKRLGNALIEKGISIVNLSPESRLTAFKKCSIEQFFSEESKPAVQSTKKVSVFVVNYRFLSCGDVFKTGLQNACEDLGVKTANAYWNDPDLYNKVQEFNPDLLFVIHGRKFVARWKNRFSSLNTAVWLLDEPYEVDDSSKYSREFKYVFVNDTSTLFRHANSHYLPTCFDPHVHFATNASKKYFCGFIGGRNEMREEILSNMAKQGLLSYVVGGPWNSEALKKISLGTNIPAEKTAELYQNTSVILNIYRETHHFNSKKIPATSLNPRIYEAIACGALVVSQPREESGKILTSMPVFNNKNELSVILKKAAEDSSWATEKQKDCYAQILNHTYTTRLQSVIKLCVNKEANSSMENSSTLCVDVLRNESAPGVKISSNIQPGRIQVPLAEWIRNGEPITESESTLEIYKTWNSEPGSEEGIECAVPLAETRLSFELFLDSDTVFLAKINQSQKHNQASNSYHLYSSPQKTYLARHNLVLAPTRLKREQWEKVCLSFAENMIGLEIGSSNPIRVKDHMLTDGYAFLGIKGGHAKIRNICLSGTAIDRSDLPQNQTPRMTAAFVHKDNDKENSHGYDILFKPQYLIKTPRVSIVTTVYDRVDCLRECILSVKAQKLTSYEHIVVADRPSDMVLQEISAVVKETRDDRLLLATTLKRHNNWGITPAEVGLLIGRGEYVAFLSDDNGYLPEHLSDLVDILNNRPDIGFTYSSCLYDGRKVLDSPKPLPAAIDLGQPLFRREVLQRNLGCKIPFNEFAWDWRMINHLMNAGVRWYHHNKATFIFRLKKYPQLRAAEPVINRQLGSQISKSAIYGSITVSIVCYNNLAVTKRCIQSVLNTVPPDTEIIVTDNASVDETVGWLKSLNDPRLVIIENQTNIGYGSAHRNALNRARGSFFILLNNDCVTASNWTIPLVEALLMPEIRIAGPFGGKLDKKGIGKIIAAEDIEYIEGSCCAIQTAFARSVGLFDPQFEFMYCEDADLSLRVRARGFKIKRVACNVRHEGASSVKKANDIDIEGYRLKNHYRLCKKWRTYLDTRRFDENLYIKRSGAIGDVFLLTPVIEQLYSENIHRHIHIITSCPQLLEGNPHISSISKLPPENLRCIDLDQAYEREPYRHIVDCYASCCNIKQIENRRPVYYLDNKSIETARSRFAEGYITVHAGPSTWPGRQPPIETLRETVAALKADGYKVVEIGHQRHLDNADLCACGCTWRETAAVLHNAAAFIGIDSAPFHLAQAFDLPGAVLFGCIDPKYRLVNPGRLRPVTTPLACLGCHHWREAPRTFSDCLRGKAECMNRITPQMIMEEFIKAMKSGPGKLGME